MNAQHDFTPTVKEETDRDTPRKFHTCDLCLYGTKSISTILSHVRGHRSTTLQLLSCTERSLELYKCNSCDFEKYLKVDLHEHTKMTHENEESNQPVGVKFDLVENFNCYNCVNCNFQTYSLLILMKHVYGRCIKVNNKFGDTQGDQTKCKTGLKCHQCIFKANENILKLDLVAEEVKWYCCEQCSYKAKLKSGLKAHILKKHTVSQNIKWFECANCVYKSKLKSNLKEHIMRKHIALQNIEWFECKNCSYKLKSKCELKAHIVRKHTAPQNIKWFQCENCAYKSKWKGTLKEHIMRNHTTLQNIKWFECKNCSYKLKSKYELKTHIVSKHTAPQNIKWFQCENCPYKSKVKSNLKKHVLKKHTAF